MTTELPPFVIEAHRFVQKYGEVLEKSRGMVRNEKLLPTSKKIIKASLLTLLRIEKDEIQRRILKDGYVYVAHFQSLTDAEMIALEQYEKSAAGISTRSDSTNNAEQKSALLATLTTWPVYKALVERRFEEEEVLTRELSVAGTHQ